MYWLIILILVLGFVSFIAVWWFFMYMKQRDQTVWAKCPKCGKLSNFWDWTEYGHFYSKGVYLHYQCPECSEDIEQDEMNFDV